MTNKPCETYEPLILAGFFGALALGTYLGYRAAPKHPMMGGVVGLGLSFVPAWIGTAVVVITVCGT